MLLLDSLYINNSGGKILLDYLVETLEENNIPTYYLFDDRCKMDYQSIPNARKRFIKASLVNRYTFYKLRKDNFTKVFCFGNLPPVIHLDIPVFTYFHQPLFLDIPVSLSMLKEIEIKLKTLVLDGIKSNTNIWFVQSEYIKKRLASKYKIDLNHIKLMPFYPPLTSDKKIYTRRKDGFVYISNGERHKNHNNLINAFCTYFDKNKKGILHLTVGSKFPQLFKFINNKIDQGYPIINHGFVTRNDLVEIYQTNEYLIFPSLAESFGLGLVEAIENGCKVIGADLPYTYAVCNPSMIFDPLDLVSIENAITESQCENVKKTDQLVFNQINEILNHLKS
jgi:glycosyltransferase involved in cell wall biosynthesis